MELVEFNNLEIVVDKEYKNINCYKYEDSIFFIEPNFYTQLIYLKEHFSDKYINIINKILEIALRNKKVVFTGDFENPVVNKDDFIYREINDVLAELKLYFDNKTNPDSDWKD